MENYKEQDHFVTNLRGKRQKTPQLQSNKPMSKTYNNFLTVEKNKSPKRILKDVSIHSQNHLNLIYCDAKIF